MTTPVGRRIPVWVKVAYSAYVVVLVPCYWVAYTPWNFLYFCDIALLVTGVAIWIESPLLVSMQAVAITLPQMLWVVDLLCRLVAGVHVTGSPTTCSRGAFPCFCGGSPCFTDGFPSCCCGCSPDWATTDGRSPSRPWPPSSFSSSRIFSPLLHLPHPRTRTGR